MRVEAVLFDLFNTLVLLEGDDAFYMPSLRKLHRFLVKNSVNVSFEDFTQAYFKVRDSLYADTNKTLEDPHFNVRVSKTLQEFGYKFGVSQPTVIGATEAFSKEFLKYMHPDDDALYVLEKLHGKHKLGIVSNLSIPEIVSKLLPKFGLDRFFSVVVVSGAINTRKPSPIIFEKALKTLNVEAKKTVFVGDTLGVDIKGAKAVGLKTVLIEREPSPKEGSIALAYTPAEEDKNVKPDKVIKNLRQLLDIVEDC